MAPHSWKRMFVFCLALAPITHTEQYRPDFVNGAEVSLSEHVQNLAHPGTTSTLPISNQPANAQAISTQDTTRFSSDVGAAKEDEPVPSDTSVALPSEETHQETATIQDVLRNQTSLLILGLWLRSESCENIEMMQIRAGKLEALPEKVRNYVLKPAGELKWFAVSESGLLDPLEPPATPNASSCLHWLWDRPWKRVYLLAHLELEDAPKFIVQYLRDNPTQAIFRVVQGRLFFGPGTLHGPLTYWLGWSALHEGLCL